MDDQTLLIPTDLPGASTMDMTLVEETLAQIEELHTEGAVATATAIGRRVLVNMFGGRSEAFEGAYKTHLSFQELVRHERLAISRKHLYRALRLVEQQRVLPEVLSDQLGWSHQLKLLPMHHAPTKVRLAERAVAEDWTARQLEAAVREANGFKPGRGRRAKPRFHKDTQAGAKRLRAAFEAPLEGPEWEGYTDEDGMALVDLWDELFEAYQAARPQWVARFGG